MLDVGVHAGLEHLGIPSRTVAYAEWDAYAASQLVALMEAGCLDAAPVWCGDLGRIDGKSLRGRVDAVIGGFPCQPHSVAGKREGTNDERWIWPAIVGLIRDTGAWLVVLENVRGLLSSGGMGPVLADLSSIGFDAEWTVLSAGEVGASHRRERVFIVGVKRGVAHAESLRGSMRPHGRCGDDAGSESSGRTSQRFDAGAELDSNGALADTGSGAIRRDCGAASCAETEDGGRRTADGDGAQRLCERMADTRSGLIPQPGRGSQGRNGARSAEPVLECEFCGYEFDAECGRYGCPNCEGEGLAHPGEPRPQGSQQHRACDGDRGGAETHGSVEQLRSLFAPGPGDPSWPDILRNQPWLAPATESGVCMHVDGLALMVDESRRDQLRCVGNGVVPLQAAAAIVGLVRRLTE